ncbi:hypothetical protein QWZ16_24515 [Vibrio ostreicida]|uniref:Secreted protein n=1 Tax=Vibrio ostreicida TaxID=526588 RepID=A0ABT8C0Y5_9VIBR|nr:hypothetical protein [Vibrio ostreicida]MDN3612732.1 hypothetical protein [Vibrio ostreicida]
MKLKQLISCIALCVTSSAFANTSTYVYCGLPDGSDGIGCWIITTTTQQRGAVGASYPTQWPLLQCFSSHRGRV